MPKGKVVMPETVEYSGKTFPLTALGEGVFFLCSDITSLSLPEGLTIIDKGAFSCCFGMETIDLPNSLQRIGDYA